MPIGSGATYAPFYATQTPAAGPAGENPLPGLRGPGMILSGGLPVSHGTLGYSIDPAFNVVTSASDPLRNVYMQTSWGPGRASGAALQPKYPGGPTPWQIHIPDSMIIPDASGNSTPNAVGALIQPDGTIYNFNVMCRPVAAADDFHAYTLGYISSGVLSQATIDADASIYSNGMYGNHGGSCLSGYGGCLMSGELTGPDPIRHALAMSVNGAEYLYYDHAGSNKGFRWPAVTNDAAAQWLSDWYGGYHGHYPDMTMGSLLAVPPAATEASLGLLTRSGKKIFHAAQDYGIYIVDDTGWSEVDFDADVTADAEHWSYYGYGINGGNPQAPWGTGSLDYYNDLYAIGSNLQVVSNNAANNVGGGGTPRVPLAPPFAS